MKFALLTLEYPCLPAGRRRQYGGVATYYGGMVEELRTQGHEVEVVEKGLVSQYVNPHWFAGIITVWRFLRKSKPDFFIVGHVLPLGTIAYLFRKRVPYIVSTHGMDVALAANSFRKKFLATKILQNAHRVIANSEFTANLVRGFGVQDAKIVVLHPCPQMLSVAPEKKVQEVRTTLGLTGKLVVLSVGRLVARKGFDTLIDAMPMVLEKHPNAVLVIAGGGAERDMLATKIVTQKVQGSVWMVGAVDNETLAALYQSADIFAMPCRAIGADVEGFGTVYLEAGLFGVPSIAGKSGGAGEAVIDEKTGMVVEPETLTVAAAISHLLEHDDQRTELGAAAKVFAGTFSWKKNVDELLKSVAKLQSYPVA